MRALSAADGLSLIEVAILLTATLAIAGALAPSVTATVRNAQTSTATTVMGQIATQVQQALSDMNYNNFTTDGQKNGPKVNLLVSDGDIPREVSATGSASWQAFVDDVTIDFLEYHLVTNTPGGDPLNAYSPGLLSAWRGAYLNAPVDADPWGNRYMVNVQWLGSGGANANDVVVYSAGPDETIDTAYAADPLAAGNDDLITLVEP
jgi:hypothetical protein